MLEDKNNLKEERRIAIEKALIVLADPEITDHGAFIYAEALTNLVYEAQVARLAG